VLICLPHEIVVVSTIREPGVAGLADDEIVHELIPTVPAATVVDVVDVVEAIEELVVGAEVVVVEVLVVDVEDEVVEVLVVDVEDEVVDEDEVVVGGVDVVVVDEVVVVDVVLVVDVVVVVVGVESLKVVSAPPHEKLGVSLRNPLRMSMLSTSVTVYNEVASAASWNDARIYEYWVGLPIRVGQVMVPSVALLPITSEGE
jgi:hypothetical protein